MSLTKLFLVFTRDLLFALHLLLLIVKSSLLYFLGGLYILWGLSMPLNIILPQKMLLVTAIVLALNSLLRMAYRGTDMYFLLNLKSALISINCLYIFYPCAKVSNII